MALNYSQRPIFSAYMPEDNLAYGDSQEKDIYDILPADPFGMDITSTVTAITWWLKYMGTSDHGGYQRDGNVVVEDSGYQICGGSNSFNTLYRSDRFVTENVYRHFPDVTENVESRSYGDYFFGEFVTNEESGYYIGENSIYDGHRAMDNGMFEEGGGSSCSSIVCEEENRVGGVVDESVDESPHPALSFALAHLGVRDLLAVERVCKSLRFTVQNDPLIWRSIQIDHPLNARISDNVLVQLCSRAQGLLQSLRIVDCKFVTNDGIRRVLESGRSLTKLSIQGCKNLKLDGILDCLTAFQSRAVTGIKCIHVAGLSISPEQYQKLLFLLRLHNPVQLDHRKPRFFCRGTIDTSCEDDRPIDVEICPKCKLVKLVYDCTAECCQGKDQGAHLCRACIQCINRCYQCGRCIDSVVHEEDFFLDYVCSDCSPTKLMCQDGDDVESCSSTHMSRDLDG